jgi:Mg-chelatase subunit ChlD
MRVAFLVVMFAAVASAAPKVKPQPNGLVLLIDRSGSMQGPKLDAAKAAVLAAFDAVGAADRVAVITFDSEAKLHVPLTSDRKSFKAAVDKIDAGGGTNIYPALKLAFDTLKPQKLAHRHVILFTDGEAPTDGIPELVSDMRASGITLSAVGVQGADRNLLVMIADAGNGRVYMIDDIAALPKVFAKEVAAAMR